MQLTGTTIQVSCNQANPNSFVNAIGGGAPAIPAQGSIDLPCAIFDGSSDNAANLVTDLGNIMSANLVIRQGTLATGTVLIEKTIPAAQLNPGLTYAQWAPTGGGRATAAHFTFSLTPADTNLPAGPIFIAIGVTTTNVGDIPLTYCSNGTVVNYGIFNAGPATGADYTSWSKAESDGRYDTLGTAATAVAGAATPYQITATSGSVTLPAGTRLASLTRPLTGPMFITLPPVAGYSNGQTLKLIDPGYCSSVNTVLVGSGDADNFESPAGVSQYVFSTFSASEVEFITNGDDTWTLPAYYTLGALTLPPGAIGAWYADQATLNDHPCIPNSVSAVPPSKNLFTGSQRMYANTQFWNSVGATIVDANLSAIDGRPSASTLMATGNWYFGINSGNANNFPAGTYTVAVEAKTNTTNSQYYAFSPDNTGSHSPAKTAEAGWTRQSFTFTKSAPFNPAAILLCSSDGATGASIQFRNFSLYAGSVDPGTEPLGGHLFLGRTAFDPTISVSGGVADLSTGGLGLIQFPGGSNFTNFTAVCVASKVAAGSGYDGFLSNAANYGAGTAFFEVNTRAAALDTTSFGEQAGLGLWNFLNRGYFSFTSRYNGTTFDVYLNGAHLLSKTGGATFNASDFFVGLVGDITLTCGYKITSLALWPTALTDAQVAQAHAALVARASASAITLTTPRFYVALGDSISGGFTTSFPYLAGAAASPAVVGANYAVSGSGIPTVISGQLPQLTAFVASKPAGSKIIVSLLLGTNDLNATNATFASDLSGLCDTIRALGVKLILGTVPPRVTGNVNAQRGAVNTSIRGWVGTHIDAVQDFAADPTIGPDAAASNTSLYRDGTHPTDSAFATYLEPIAVAALNSL